MELNVTVQAFKYEILNKISLNKKNKHFNTRKTRYAIKEVVCLIHVIPIHVKITVKIN